MSDLAELLRRVELLENEQSQIREQLATTEGERNAYHELVNTIHPRRDRPKSPSAILDRSLTGESRKS